MLEDDDKISELEKAFQSIVNGISVDGFEKKSQAKQTSTKKATKKTVVSNAKPKQNKKGVKNMPTPTKKAVAKKPAVKKAVAKKPVAKKAVAKKPAVKKAVAKKPVAKKTVAKKAVAKKPAVKKAVAKKTVAKKPVAKKK